MRTRRLPHIATLTERSLLSRNRTDARIVMAKLRAFLPAMDTANQKLRTDVDDHGQEKFDIENVEDAEECIEMVRQ